MEIEAPATIVEYIPGASDFRSKLKVLANAKRKYSVIQVSTIDVRIRQSEIIKDNVIEVREHAKTMSDTVICSGSLSTYRADDTTVDYYCCMVGCLSGSDRITAWSSPEEPAKIKLDPWYFQVGHRQPHPR